MRERTVNYSSSSLKHVDIGTVAEVREGITGLTGLDFSVYDQTGHLLVPSAIEDPFSVLFRKNYEQFVKICISKAILRKGFSIFKGSMDQYQCLIPAQIGSSWLILVGNSFYRSAKDLDDFFLSKRSWSHYSEKDANTMRKQLLFNSTKTISEIYGNVWFIFNLLIKESYKKTQFRENYRNLRTLLRAFSDMDHDVNEEKVYDVLCDAVTFLFNGDAVTLMRYEDNGFVMVRSAGKINAPSESISLRGTISIISEAVKNNRSVYCTEATEIRKLGFSEDITSLYVFPLLTNHEPLGLLFVFNSRLSEESRNSISNLCGFSAFILEHCRRVNNNTRGLVAIEVGAHNLTTLEDSDSLYESIVEVSSRSLNAQKVSLMLPENGSGVLFIKSMRGMNRWIAKNVRVQVGEGIAGKVYRTGTPFMTADKPTNLSEKNRPQYRTKSFVSIPLTIGEETIGVLNLTDKLNGGSFSHEDMEFLRYFASYASIAIKGTHYYQLAEQMKALTITDSLTRLFTRRYFDERLSEELQRASRYDSVFSLAILDIDDFRVLHDTEGHLTGDEVLKAIAHITRESLRSVDVLARFGREEFSIIMPQTDREESYLVSERVRKNIKELLHSDRKNFHNERMTVSIGVATYPLDGKDAKGLIRNADRALYRAKFGGKDRTVAFGLVDSVLI